MDSTDRAKSFLQMIRKAQRGRLKIYLGYGPGVGKTYLMLQEAHRLKKDRVDVVVGIVETHGREDTAKQVEGLELVTRRQVEYHGINLDEMDLDEILKRRPEVVLVDELAHTNVPGSRNSKRYEDVQEILAAGIHVIGTLNVQHLESLYNTVERLIGIKVRERIPDSVIADADEVINVDLSPEDLKRRLKDGKIYPKDRVAAASENFFVQENLEQLRELTMREIASQIDFKRREVWHDDDKTAPDQLMVCLASKGPNSASLLRFASRVAGRLNRNWYAVYVQTPLEDPTLIDSTTQRLLADTLTLANQLGAAVFTFKGTDIAQTILNFAKEYRVGQIVIGRPRAISTWKRRLFGRKSVAEELVVRGEGFNIIVADSEPKSQTKRLLSRDDVTSEEITKNQSRVISKAGKKELISNLVRLDRILFFDVGIAKDEVLRKLATCIARDDAAISVDKVLEAIKFREAQGSTFLNEGIAFPHGKVPHLEHFELAIAVTREGLLDVATERQIEVILMLLEPDNEEKPHLRVFPIALRVFQNSKFKRSLHEAATPEKLIQLMASIEASV